MATKQLKKAAKKPVKAPKKSTSSSKYITVNVTKTGITKGKIYSTDSCPVARSLRALGARHVDVNNRTAYFTLKDKHYFVDLPQNVQNFILKFDTGDEVKPFSFRLKLV